MRGGRQGIWRGGWENGYVESFNGKLRDELLNGEVFNTLREAQVLIEEWRRHYNLVRPHSSLGYRPPARATMAMMGPSGSSESRLAVVHQKFARTTRWGLVMPIGPLLDAGAV